MQDCNIDWCQMWYEMNEQAYRQTTEHRLIEWIRGVVGNNYIGDDCAVLPGQMLVTADTLVEGTHFLPELIKPADLGWKAVAANLSDIAAMAGYPRHIIVNLTLPSRFNFSDFRQLFLAMVDCARTYRTTIAGGDLTRGPVLVLTLTVLGQTNENGCLLRSGACPGDLVIVSGDFGASAAGLWALRAEKEGYEKLKMAHLRPRPRLSEAWQLVAATGSRGSLMDASDGLADALVQIARESSVGMEIDAAAVPVCQETEEAARIAGANPLDWALYGGEDYELVATIPPSAWDAVRKSPDNCFTAIGRVKAGSGICLRAAEESELDLSKCFQHWGDI